MHKFFMFNNCRLIINPEHISSIIVTDIHPRVSGNIYSVHLSCGMQHTLNKEEYEKLIQFLIKEEYLNG